MKTHSSQRLLKNKLYADHPEIKLAIGSSVKALWEDPLYRGKQTEAISKVCSTKKFRKLLSRKAKELWKNDSWKAKTLSAMNASSAKKRRSKARKEIWNRPGYKEHMSLKLKHAWARSGKKKREEWVKAAMSAVVNKPNYSEKKLGDILERHFPGDFRMNVSGEVVIGGKIPDFVNVNGKKLVVELFGSKWHKLEEEKSRKAFLKKYGFKTVVIWQKELKDEVLVVEKVRFQGGYK